MLFECLAYFQEIYEQRKKEPPRFDLISMLAHDESTNNMEPQELLGNVMLLIVGGNDTTRNSISGGVLALNQNPEQYEKLLQNPGLIPKMVPEIIRWQSPVAHMARTALSNLQIRQLTRSQISLHHWNRTLAIVCNTIASTFSRSHLLTFFSFPFAFRLPIYDFRIPTSNFCLLSSMLCLLPSVL